MWGTPSGPVIHTQYALQTPLKCWFSLFCHQSHDKSARKQRCLSFLLSDRKDVCMRIFCLTVRQKPGHMSGRMAGTDQEVPTGISVWWAGWDCGGQGVCAANPGLTVALWAAQACVCSGCLFGIQPLPSGIICHVSWQRWTEWKLQCCSLWGWCAHLQCKIDCGAWKIISWCQRGCRACNCRFQYSVISKENSLGHCSI